RPPAGVRRPGTRSDARRGPPPGREARARARRLGEPRARLWPTGPWDPPPGAPAPRRRHRSRVPPGAWRGRRRATARDEPAAPAPRDTGLRRPRAWEPPLEAACWPRPESFRRLLSLPASATLRPPRERSETADPDRDAPWPKPRGSPDRPTLRARARCRDASP